MKRRINLLKTRHKSITIITEKVMAAMYVLALILFAGILFVNWQIITINNSFNQMVTKKDQLLQFLVNNKKLDSQLVYFKAKTNQLSEFEKEDAQFYPYYQLLNEGLNYASDSSSLESVAIDKNKETVFTVAIPDLTTAMNFLKFIESDKFTSNFTQLALINFSLIQPNKESTQKKYVFKFEGKFKQININDY